MTNLRESRSLKKSELNDADAQRYEQVMLEELLESDLTPLEQEFARNLAVPILTALCRGNVEDMDVRELVTTIVIKNIALAFGYYLEREIRPEFVPTFTESFVSHIYHSTKEAYETLATSRAAGNTKEID